MQTISIVAIPKYRNCGLKTEVLYQVRSVMSPDNPLNQFYKDMEKNRFYTPGKGVKLPKWFNEFAYKNAKKISSAFFSAWGRTHFEKGIDTVRLYTVLKDENLIQGYLEAKEKLSDDREGFTNACYKLCLEQKLLDLEADKNTYDKLCEEFLDPYYHWFYPMGRQLDGSKIPDFCESIENVLKSRFRRKEAEINLLRHKLGLLEYHEFKQFTQTCSAGECDWLRFMSQAKSLVPVVNIGVKSKFEGNVYQYGELLAKQSDDMSTERLKFLLLMEHYCMGFGYDLYLNVEDEAVLQKAA